MQKTILTIVAVALVGCASTPNNPLSDIVEKAIRAELKKPEGKLTKADLDRVEGLELQNTGVTNDGLREVAKLQNLKFLDLGKAKITNEGIKALVKLPKLSNLSLRGCKRISDPALMELVKMKQLTRLGLLETNIASMEAVQQLKKALQRKLQPMRKAGAQIKYKTAHRYRGT